MTVDLNNELAGYGATKKMHTQKQYRSALKTMSNFRWVAGYTVHLVFVGVLA